MQVILQEKMANLGGVGDQVSVKPGFARNYLLPTGKAVRATAVNIAQFETRRAELEKKAAEALVAAKQRAEQVNQLMVSIEAQAGEGGKLFGSVGARDIALAAVAAGLELKKNEVQMSEGPIRQLGEHSVTVQLHSDVTAMLKIHVIAQA